MNPKAGMGIGDDVYNAAPRRLSAFGAASIYGKWRRPPLEPGCDAGTRLIGPKSLMHRKEACDGTCRLIPQSCRAFGLPAGAIRVISLLEYASSQNRRLSFGKWNPEH